jgi:Nucleotide-diphospho-sugar transferase
MRSTPGVKEDTSCMATVAQLREELASANERVRQCRSESKKTALAPDCGAGVVAVKQENEDLRKQLDESKGKLAAKSSDRSLQSQPTTAFQLPDSIRQYALQMVTLPKLEFLNHFNYQLPLDPSTNDVLLIYSSGRALPDGVPTSASPFTRMESTEEAVRNCDFVNLIMTSNHDNKQCVALVPQWESHHIHKFARVDLSRPNNQNKMNSSLPLIPVSRGTRDDGIHRLAPDLPSLQKSWKMMTSYLQQLPKSLKTLKRLLRPIAVNNTVVIMVTNFGQAELLLNFHCSAKARRLKVSNILVVALDTSTRDLATGLGYSVFYDEAMFGHVPAGEYGEYHARTVAFMAKVQAVHMASLLKYDVLYQDVDVIWYRDPLPFFLNSTGPYASHDAVFNDDGSRSKRFMTYFANAGFYFIRSNVRTRAFLNRWVTSAELTFQYECDQEVLNIMLSEGRSLFGLDVAVISRDNSAFWSGYHFHLEDPRDNPIHQMMVQQYNAANQTKAVSINGRDDQFRPYILHMHFTANKEFKREFYSQMGEWRVHEQCLEPDPAKVLTASRRQQCCVAEPPPVTCFYRNRPSAIPCHDSPPVPESESTSSIWQ